MVDDEAHIIELARLYFEREGFRVSAVGDGEAALEAVPRENPALVVLDVMLPKLDGFEVVELAGRKSRYIFVTAYDQYALKAFDVHAIDYLLKPFSQKRLDEALAHARSGMGSQPGLAAAVSEAAQRTRPLERVLIRDGAKVHVLAADRIDFIEAQDDYVRISAEGKSWLKTQRLSDLESQLDPHAFLRIHRSYIVNVERISRIEQAGKDSHMAILKDGARIPISRTGYQKVRSLIQ